MKHFFFFPAFVLIAFAVTAQTTLSTGLVAYYKFNFDYTDSSGNANHGTPSGTPLFSTDRNGNLASAATFIGNAYVTVPASASLNSPGSEFSCAAWVKIMDWHTSGSYKYAPLFCKSASFSATQYRLVLEGSAFNLISSGKVTVFQTAAFDTGTWYHVATVSRNDTSWFYLNGTLAGTKRFTGTYANDTTQPLEIGRDYPGGIEYFRGLLDELRIYKRALSGQEVADIYNMATTGLSDDAVSKTMAPALYPNPSTGIVYLDSRWATRKATIVNTLGESVNIQPVDGKLDLQHLAKGLYFIQISDASGALSTQHMVLE